MGFFSMLGGKNQSNKDIPPPAPGPNKDNIQVEANLQEQQKEVPIEEIPMPEPIEAPPMYESQVSEQNKDNNQLSDDLIPPLPENDLAIDNDENNNLDVGQDLIPPLPDTNPEMETTNEELELPPEPDNIETNSEDDLIPPLPDGNTSQASEMDFNPSLDNLPSFPEEPSIPNNNADNSVNPVTDIPEPAEIANTELNNIPNAPDVPESYSQPNITSEQIHETPISSENIVPDAKIYDNFIPENNDFKLDLPELDLPKEDEISENFKENKIEVPTAEDFKPRVETNVFDKPKIASDKVISVHKQAGGPMFIEVNDYKDLLDNVDGVKNMLKESGGHLFKVEEFTEKKHKKYDEWKELLEDIQRKLVFVEKTLFDNT